MLDDESNKSQLKSEVMDIKVDEKILNENEKVKSLNPSMTEENFQSLFARYHCGLKRFISGFLMNPQDIEDVCQETFLRTYKSSIEADIKKPKSFLFRVAKNLIISDFRRASSRLTEYVEDIDLVDSIIDPDDLEHNAVAQEKLGIMCESIATLPDKCRQAVVMRKVYGLSTKVIAQRMNISVITVSNYITKGMCTYNEAVNRYNADQTQSQHKTTILPNGKRRKS
jgi:RNA polymerase sigma-70 factor (ECF subfamily)